MAQNTRHMHKKGNAPLLGKLQNLQLIEGDLKIRKELIEKDLRFSKANHGSRIN